MTPSLRPLAFVLTALVLVAAVVVIGWRCDRDMALAHAHATQGVVRIPTPGATRDGTVVRGTVKF